MLRDGGIFPFLSSSFFAKSLCIYYLFRELTINSLPFFANSLLIHHLFGEIPMNSLSLSRIHYKLITCFANFSRIYHEFTICFAYSLWIHYCCDEFTIIIIIIVYWCLIQVLGVQKVKLSDGIPRRGPPDITNSNKGRDRN